MISLPHALLFAPDTPRPPASGIVAVPAVVDVAGLRRLLAAGATALALDACRAGADVERLAVLLCVAEAENGLADGSVAILAITDGILPAPLSPQGFSGRSGRLSALVWAPGKLKAGALRAARDAVLLTAAATGLPAYDRASALADDALVAACTRSRDDGFFGRIACDTAQARVIEAIYGASAA